LGATKTTHPVTLPINFCKLSQLESAPCLLSQDEPLDRFLGGLRLGSSYFLYGSFQCLAVSESLCIRAQLSPQCGGLGSEAVFLDGGNSFDPYLATEYAEYCSLDRNRALDRILVSRAFTYPQLTALITQKLPEVVHKRGIRLVVISDLPRLYNDSDIQSGQSLGLLKTALSSLATTARVERTIILATDPDEKQSYPDQFQRAVRRRMDIVLRYEERPHYTRLILEKHPTLPRNSLLIKKPTPKILEKFLEANVNG